MTRAILAGTTCPRSAVGFTKITALVFLVFLFLSSSSSVVAHTTVRDAQGEEPGCIHDKIAASEDIHNLTYVRLLQQQQHDEAQHTHGFNVQGISHTPRRGAVPASMDFTVNVPRSTGDTATVTNHPSNSSGHDAANMAASTAQNEGSEWQPIRIRAFFEDILNSDRYCTAVGDVRPEFSGAMVRCSSEADVLTAKKRDILMNLLVPSAIQMHMKRLKVKPVPANTSIVVSAMPGRWCSSFTVPAAHRTTGVSDADFVVYVSAGPSSTPTSFVAWAIGCQYFPGDNRPAVAAINFNPRYLIEEADETAEDIANGGDATSVLDNRIRVAAHELLHALGFSYNPFHRAGMITTVHKLRGKPAVLVVNTPSVRKAAMEHYGCQDASSFRGMELEDQGASGTSGSHWKRRNARDDLMSPVANFMRFTAITLAAMADLGYYQVSYDGAEYMGWGNEAGCQMLTEKCVTPPSAPVSTSPSIFCSESSTSGGRRYCSRDRLAIGRCYIATYNAALPAYMQYFTDPLLGGGESYVDYCPTVQAYANTGCKDGTLTAMPGSVTGDSARCFSADASSGSLVIKNSFAAQDAICATVQCNFTTNKYHVLFQGASRFVECVPGEAVEPAATSGDVFQAGGRVHCPAFLDVCGANPKARFALPPPSAADSASGCSTPFGFLKTKQGVTSSFIALAVVAVVHMGSFLVF